MPKLHFKSLSEGLESLEIKSLFSLCSIPWVQSPETDRQNLMDRHVLTLPSVCPGSVMRSVPAHVVSLHPAGFWECMSLLSWHSNDL